VSAKPHPGEPVPRPTRTSEYVISCATRQAQAFKTNQSEQRRAMLAEISRQAYADGLYGRKASDYTQALHDARHSKDQ
jgi:hypothetical protein